MRRLLLVAVLFSAVLLAQAPTVGENGVVNAASLIPFGRPGHANAPGSIVSIFGTNFASGLSTSMSIPLSTSLGGVSVTFNGIPAPLFAVTSGQINAQMPFGVSGTTATVVVSTAAGSSAPRTIQTAPTSPAIFTLTQQGMGQAIVVFALEPTALASPPMPALQLPACPPPQAGQFCARPARAGDFLTIYANGLGAVTPAVPDGNAAPAAEPLARTPDPTVMLGGRACRVLFAGLVPGLVALNQINVEVPAGVTPGNAVPLTIALGGVTSSELVTIAVQ